MADREHTMSFSFQSLSVLVPVVTETDSLIETVKTLIRVCNRQDLKEIIICPAHFASQKSKSIAEELCQNHADVPVKLLMQNGSFENLMKDVFTTVAGSHFMFQPSDLEEDPRMVAVFIEKCKEHPDAVISGSRFLTKRGPKDYSKMKRFVFFFFRRLFKAVYRCDLTDTTFFYQIIPTEKVQNLVLTNKSFSVLYEVFLKLVRTGTEIIEIPVEYSKRAEGKSKVSFFKDGLSYMKVFWSVRFSDVRKFYCEFASTDNH